MKKSLIGRCIRRWKVRFKPLCDSKLSPYWRVHHLNGYLREYAKTMADCMIQELAESNAHVDFGIDGWSPEFSQWFSERRTKYLKEALDYLNEDASNEEIDDLIEKEISVWC